MNRSAPTRSSLIASAVSVAALFCNSFAVSPPAKPTEQADAVEHFLRQSDDLPADRAANAISALGALGSVVDTEEQVRRVGLRLLGALQDERRGMARAGEDALRALLRSLGSQGRSALLSLLEAQLETLQPRAQLTALRIAGVNSLQDPDVRLLLDLSRSSDRKVRSGSTLLLRLAARRNEDARAGIEQELAPRLEAANPLERAQAAAQIALVSGRVVFDGAPLDSPTRKSLLNVVTELLGSEDPKLVRGGLEATRALAAATMGRIPQSLNRVLIDLLDHTEPEIRVRAASILFGAFQLATIARAQTEAFVPKLTQILANGFQSEDRHLGDLADAALSSHLSRFAREKLGQSNVLLASWADHLARLLTSPDADTRIRGAQDLLSFIVRLDSPQTDFSTSDSTRESVAGLFQHLSKILKDSKPEVRAEAIEPFVYSAGMMNRSPHETTAVLLAALEDADPSVRRAALSGFGAANIQPAAAMLEPIRQRLNDPYPQVALQANRTLMRLAFAEGHISSMPAFESTRRGVESVHEAVRITAVDRLRLQFIRTVSFDNRLTGADSLDQRGPSSETSSKDREQTRKELLPPLSSALNDHSPRVRSAALEALQEIGSFYSEDNPHSIKPAQ